MKKRPCIWKRAESGLRDVFEGENASENIVIKTNKNNKKQQENEVSGGKFSLHV